MEGDSTRKRLQHLKRQKEDVPLKNKTQKRPLTATIDNDGFQIPPKKITFKARPTPTLLEPTKTTNSFTALTDTTADNTLTTTTSTAPIPQPKKPAPIVLRPAMSAVELRKALLESNIKTFIIRSNKDENKIFLATVEDYNSTLKLLKDSGIIYHSYAHRGTKPPKKYIIKGFDVDHPIADIKEALQARLKGFKTIWRMRKSDPQGNKTELSHLIVTTEFTTTLDDLKKVGPINHIIYSVEKLRNINGPRQCHNCQEFGHTKNYCGRVVTCVRCGENHNTQACPRLAPPKCANCGGPHVASYRNCPKRQELIQNKLQSKVVIKPNENETQDTTTISDPHSYAGVLHREPPPPVPATSSEPAWVSELMSMFRDMKTMFTSLLNTLNIVLQKSLNG